MRTSPNHTSAAPLPFAGLGLSTAPVRAAAEAMRPVFRKRERPAGPRLPRSLPGTVRQPSGYSLLVALGREIRGR